MSTRKQRGEKRKQARKATRSEAARRQAASARDSEPVGPSTLLAVRLPVDAWISVAAGLRAQAGVTIPADVDDEEQARAEHFQKTLTLSADAIQLALEERAAR